MKNIPYKTACTNGLPYDGTHYFQNMQKTPRIELKH
jgi:hypothetical protein